MLMKFLVLKKQLLFYCDCSITKTFWFDLSFYIYFLLFSFEYVASGFAIIRMLLLIALRFAPY